MNESIRVGLASKDIGKGVAWQAKRLEEHRMVDTKIKNRKSQRESEHCEDYLWLMRSFTEEVAKEMKLLLKDVRESEHSAERETHRQKN